MESNLALYKIFYAVANAGNISRAAEQLHISQPAISKSIGRLEKNLDIILFTRNSRGVSLTDEGKILYQYVNTAFEAISSGEENLRYMSKLGVGHIRIGVSATLCKYLLLPYLKGFVFQYPHIKITIKCQSSIHTLNMLERGEIDIGLIGKPEIAKGLDLYSLGEIEDIFVAAPSYLDNLDLRVPGGGKDFFKNGNLMLLDEENLTRSYIDGYLRRNHIQTEHILEISDMDLLMEFARIGLGIACVVREFVKDDIEQGGLVELPLPVPIPKREISFACSSATGLSQPGRLFWEFCTSTREE
ncbi:LysR family transcriptional regulator [Parasporobacterium paucivorans]|uniref:Transcriptional regulator, LysR family n=1 Tax=Parasporobacterium paucivorans DSM 15970 TaxID=1122934 RepID=A0A1M6G5C4_9FIRM|nr:LysR family transcriptional regulator [Parasporobacterium paucivorans]SHJ05132.1 transcriptional regulator, LysR family [Parasporobacterium paucivorans DSM 15970]